MYERKSEFDKNAFTVKFDYSPGLPAPGETASAKSSDASLHRPFFKRGNAQWQTLLEKFFV